VLQSLRSTKKKGTKCLQICALLRRNCKSDLPCLCQIVDLCEHFYGLRSIESEDLLKARMNEKDILVMTPFEVPALGLAETAKEEGEYENNRRRS
jgi:hypothetical protein